MIHAKIKSEVGELDIGSQVKTAVENQEQGSTGRVSEKFIATIFYLQKSIFKNGGTFVDFTMKIQAVLIIRKTDVYSAFWSY